MTGLATLHETISAAGSQLHPFVGTPLYDRLSDFEREDAKLCAELQAVKAGNRASDPRHAPSLAPLGKIKRRGRTFHEALLSIASNEPGGHGEKLSPFGVELRYAGETIEMGVDVSLESKAAATLKKAWGENWRTVVIADASALEIAYLDEAKKEVVLSAWALFATPPTAR